MKLRLVRRFKGDGYTIGSLYVNEKSFVIHSKIRCETLPEVRVRCRERRQSGG